MFIQHISWYSKRDAVFARDLSSQGMFQVLEHLATSKIPQILVNVLDSGTLEIRGENIPDLGKINLVISTIDGEPLDNFDSLVQSGGFVESWKWLDVLKPGTYLVMTDLSKNGISFIVP